MKLTIIRKNEKLATGKGESLLRFAISSEPIAGVVLDGLNKILPWEHNGTSTFRRLTRWGYGGAICAIPQAWGIEPRITSKTNIIPYTGKVPIHPELIRKIKRDSWFVVSNGRFATRINNELLANVLSGIQADVVAVNAEPDLLAAREKMRLTAQGKVAGFRRLYVDCAEPAPFPAVWPHHLFVKTDILEDVLDDGACLQLFGAVLERCRSKGLALHAINVAGVVLDLETEDGLLNFCRDRGAAPSAWRTYKRFGNGSKNTATGRSSGVFQEPRLVGKNLLGEGVHIGPNVIIVGPTIIGDNVRIEPGAVINSSIIGPQVVVPRNQLVQNCIVKGPQYDRKDPAGIKSNASKHVRHANGNFRYRGDGNEVFRSWKKLSYARCLKRIADVLASIIVLILFAPVIPFIALAIKLTSPGPVFYKDRRQGLHGKLFNCLKFRTMRTGADRIQEKLRVVSQVDGPQFKIENDPRISTVGRFLRDTYIDEVPQFFNVLLGQMSVVGPRPSPESENTLCPSWRDARLSVRPGITGLWQVRRTRQPMKDFQEWIYYDIEYVRNLSLRTDLWICWQTTKKLIGNFISQFAK